MHIGSATRKSYILVVSASPLGLHSLFVGETLAAIHPVDFLSSKHHYEIGSQASSYLRDVDFENLWPNLALTKQEEPVTAEHRVAMQAALVGTDWWGHFRRHEIRHRDYQREDRKI